MNYMYRIALIILLLAAPAWGQRGTKENPIQIWGDTWQCEDKNAQLTPCTVTFGDGQDNSGKLVINAKDCSFEMRGSVRGDSEQMKRLSRMMDACLHPEK